MQSVLNKVNEQIEKYENFSTSMDSAGRTGKEQYARLIYRNFISHLTSARSKFGKQEIILAVEDVNKIVVLSKYNHHLLLDYRPTTGWIERKKLEIRQIELEQKAIKLFPSLSLKEQAEVKRLLPNLK